MALVDYYYSLYYCVLLCRSYSFVPAVINN